MPRVASNGIGLENIQIKTWLVVDVKSYMLIKKNQLIMAHHNEAASVHSPRWMSAIMNVLL